MKVIFCGGSPKAGSWIMRGQQIASTNPDWQAISEPSVAQIKEADLVVVVKRFKPHLLQRIRQAGTRMIWDALDFWPQSKEVILPKDMPDAMMLAKRHTSKIAPYAVIAANQQMARDFQTFNERVTCIYHHARLNALPIRSAGRAIYYDGCEKHVEDSLEYLRAELPKHGFELKIGQPQPDAFALFSGRDVDGGLWINKRWKSNVKAANAIAFNLPMICQQESGYLETRPGDLAFYYERLEDIPGLLQKIKQPEPNAEAILKTRLEYAAACYQRFFEAIK